MTRTIIAAAVLLAATTAFAAGPVVDSKGHVRWDLTQRDSFVRTSPEAARVEKATPAPHAPAITAARPAVLPAATPFIDSKGHVRWDLTPSPAASTAVTDVR